MFSFTPKFQNSAGRLLAMLQAIPDRKALLECLPPLMNVSASTQQEKQQASLLALMEIHRVYVEFCQDMAEANISEVQREAMLRGVKSIEASIYPRNLEEAFRKVTEAETSLLNVCATFIPEEGQIEKDDLEQITKAIAELQTLVQDASLSATLRRSLLELIRLAQDSIARFNIHGARGLRKAFKAMLGEAAELYGLTKMESKPDIDTASPTWAAVLKLLRTVDAVASRLLKYKPLLESAATMVLPAAN